MQSTLSLNKTRFSPINREFQVFSIVYAEGSISRASVRLDADQGNISRTLKALEKKTNTKLFHRHRFGVKPTEAAHELNRVLSEMVGVWQESKRGSLDSNIAPKMIRIGAHRATALVFLPKMIRFIEDSFPQNYLEVSFHTSSEIIRMVQTRDLELGIVSNVPVSKDLVVRNLAMESFVVCGRKDMETGGTVLRNPYMVQSERYIESTKFRRVVDILDYDISASIAAEDPRFATIIPKSIMARHPGLVMHAEIKKLVPVKIVTYPGSDSVGWLKNIVDAVQA